MKTEFCLTLWQNCGMKDKVSTGAGFFEGIQLHSPTQNGDAEIFSETWGVSDSRITEGSKGRI
ncbi:MAG TPA: hypothetical protein VH280_04735 [Verrucomicrobiae bacterium]|nr:hypothetical protein [Verrucomicrobiae bacterium]